MEKWISVSVFAYLSFLPGNDDVLVAAAALFGRAVDAAAGVDHIAHQVPVWRVGGRHDGQVERQLQQLLHGLPRETPACLWVSTGRRRGADAERPTAPTKVTSYLKQSPVLADEPLWVVLAGLHGWLDQRGEGLGERRLLFQREVLFLVFALATHFQHAGLLEERARRDDRFAVALFLLSGCCWVNKAKI